MGWIQKLRLRFLDEPQEVERHEEDKRTRARMATDCRQRIFFLLLDNSGSMTTRDFPPSRIGAACAAAKSTVDYLKEESPESCVGIATFSDDFHLCTPPLLVGESAEDIAKSLYDLGETGGTNMDRGFEGVHDVMKRECPDDMPSVVIALTDGHHTGPKRSLIRATENLKQDKADIWAVGIGGAPEEVDEKLLKTVCSKPQCYSFIGNWQGPQAIIGTFQNILQVYFLDEEEDREQQS